MIAYICKYWTIFIRAPIRKRRGDVCRNFNRNHPCDDAELPELQLLGWQFWKTLGRKSSFLQNEPKKLLKTKGKLKKRTENEAKAKSANLLKINDWPKIEKKRTDNKPEKTNLEKLGYIMVR